MLNVYRQALRLVTDKTEKQLRDHFRHVDGELPVHVSGTSHDRQVLAPNGNGNPDQRFVRFGIQHLAPHLFHLRNLWFADNGRGSCFFALHLTQDSLCI